MLLNRILAISASTAGVLAGGIALWLAWTAPAASLLEHLSSVTFIGQALLVSVIALLIAWRAGDHPPNVAMALAIAFVFGGDLISVSHAS